MRDGWDGTSSVLHVMPGNRLAQESAETRSAPSVAHPCHQPSAFLQLLLEMPDSCGPCEPP